MISQGIRHAFVTIYNIFKNLHRRDPPWQKQGLISSCMLFSACGLFHLRTQQAGPCRHLQPKPARDGRIPSEHGPYPQTATRGTSHIASKNKQSLDPSTALSVPIVFNHLTLITRSLFCHHWNHVTMVLCV